jgi:hypothetical protein
MKKSNLSCLSRRSFSEGGLILSKIKIPMPLSFLFDKTAFFLAGDWAEPWNFEP